MNKIYKGIFLAITITLTSCSVSKHLKEDARVHAKTRIHIKNPELVSDLKKMENRTLQLAQPKPATGFTKWQTNLYNRFSGKVERDSSGQPKGIRGWAMRNIGIPPVYYEPRKVSLSSARIRKYFNDNGYFGTVVQADTTLKKKEVTVNYTVWPKAQYQVRNVHFPKDSTELSEKLFRPKEKSMLAEGVPFNQADLTAERKRLATLANNSGFLHVAEDHFYFFVDTALGSRQVDIYLQVKQPDDSLVLQPYRLKENIVFATYSLSAESPENDTAVLENYRIIQKNEIIRPRVLAGIIGHKKGELYSRKAMDDALTRILDLGLFKFVNLKIEPENTDTSQWFNARYFLTPGLMEDVSAEFEAISRSTSYLGIASTLTYSHKNIFRGAERLDLSLSGGIGTQTNTTGNLINTLDGAFEASLTLPRLIIPFKLKSNIGATIPKTRISVGSDFQQRLEYYTVSSFFAKFGYEWASTPTRRHQLYPININQFQVRNITDEMRQLFTENPRLERTFSDVFILGLTYNFTITTQKINTSLPYIFLRTGFESSGNLPNIIIANFGRQDEKPFRIMGAPYSQFVRFDADFRFYIPRKKSMIATRFVGGIGIPYKNSELLPYIRQYFAGGPSSIRAFQFRALGPGSYTSPSANNIDQTGDIRLEASVEYRFPLISYLKGAAFLDAGNVWLIKDIENAHPGGVFKFDGFFKEIALGTGLGLRLDLNFLVVRLDMAFPLRKPFFPENDRWVIEDIDFTSKAWRKENLQWNFAIGYPF